jgi:hypothetical protein
MEQHKMDPTKTYSVTFCEHAEYVVQTLRQIFDMTPEEFIEHSVWVTSKLLTTLHQLDNLVDDEALREEFRIFIVALIQKRKKEDETC